MCKYRFFYNNIRCFLSRSVVLFVTFVTHMIQRHTVLYLGLVKVKPYAIVIGKWKTLHLDSIHNNA